MVSTNRFSQDGTQKKRKYDTRGGVGALLKHEQEEVFDEWLENDDNWNEWSGARSPASRKRGLLTQFYGVAWERVCRSFPFPKVSVC